MDSDDDPSDDEGLTLSPEAAAALRAFAISTGIAGFAVDALSSSSSENIDEAAASDLLSAVRDHFDVKDKNETFTVEYKDDKYDGNDHDDNSLPADATIVTTTHAGKRWIRFQVHGVKRMLGQTLSSTGLTIWRAAEHLCEWMFQHPERFRDRTVCELGCGLGMASILLENMSVARVVVATDGDDDTMQLLRENIARTDSPAVVAKKLYWGDAADLAGVLVDYPIGFDSIIASDVIYEEEQVEPLIATVAALLRRPQPFQSSSSSSSSSPPSSSALSNAATVMPATDAAATVTVTAPAREILQSTVNSPQPARIVPPTPPATSATTSTTTTAPFAASTSTTDHTQTDRQPDHQPDHQPEFLLAFARRNVSIDRVLEAAQRAGLRWEVLSPGLGGLEPVYSLRWAADA